jgi:hypothetical protein
MAVPSSTMKTVVLGPQPGELQALIERRKKRGIDLFDEVFVADPQLRSIACWSRDQLGYASAPSSALLAVGATQLADMIAWP